MPEKYFNLETQFMLYLQRMELKIDDMPAAEIMERKRAFISGISQLFIFIKDVDDMSTAEVLTSYVNLSDQLKKFWSSQDGILDLGGREN